MPFCDTPAPLPSSRCAARQNSQNLAKGEDKKLMLQPHNQHSASTFVSSQNILLHSLIIYNQSRVSLFHTSMKMNRNPICSSHGISCPFIQALATSNIHYLFYTFTNKIGPIKNSTFYKEANSKTFLSLPQKKFGPRRSTSAGADRFFSINY